MKKETKENEPVINENKKYILALDSGTTSCRTLIFDHNGDIVSLAQKEFTQYFPKDGWVEHDPNEIYGVQFSTIVQAIQQRTVNVKEITAIGITNQRETILIWDKKTGIPVYNAIVWQDKRTNEYCEELKKNKKLVKLIQEKTGLIIDPYFSATKIKWLFDNIKDLHKRAARKELLLGTIDTWLIWKLTNGKVHATDYTNASRTMLFNIKTLKWDEKLLKIFNIPKSILPQVKNSADDYGEVAVNFITNIKITSAIGDQQSSLFGHRRKIGEIKSTYGTGAFLMLNTGNKMIKSNNGLLTTIALGIDGKIQYALEGSIYIAGSALKWLREKVHLIDDYNQVEYYMEDGNDTGGVCVVPYFVGAGSPYWNAEARGMITGMTRGTTRTHIILATAQSIALQTKDIFNIFEKDFKQKINVMSIDGGVTNSEALMQFQADILNIKLFYPNSKEITASGAAFLAGLKVGFWKNEKELDMIIQFKKIYYPLMLEEERKAIYQNWKRSVKSALNW